MDRAGGLRGTIQENELREAGIVRADSTVSKGKGLEAQSTIVPSLTFSEQDAGRSIAGIASSSPVWRDLGALIGLIEQIKLKEGKVVAATFLNAHNQLVTQVRQLQAKALPPAVSPRQGTIRP